MLRHRNITVRIAGLLALVCCLFGLTGCIHFSGGTIDDGDWKELINRKPFDFAVATNCHTLYTTLVDSKLFKAVYQIKSLEPGTSLRSAFESGEAVIFKPLSRESTVTPDFYFEGPEAASALDWSTIAMFPYNFVMCTSNLFTAGLVLPLYVSHTYEQTISVKDTDGNELAAYNADYSEYWVGWFMYLLFETNDTPQVGGTDRQIVERFLEDYDAGKFSAGPETGSPAETTTGGESPAPKTPAEPDEPAEPDNPAEPDEPSVDPENQGR
ncbi:MAG: hypothetical protein E3J72_15665 [Planctomycetota bacterium]|nr:MAG: hypothetical protein E3J72_15665 [Planctomycetota bacterium]